MVANILRFSREERRKRGICGGGIPPEENIGGKGGIDQPKKGHFLVYCFRKRRFQDIVLMEIFEN